LERKKVPREASAQLRSIKKDQLQKRVRDVYQIPGEADSNFVTLGSFHSSSDSATEF